MQPRPRSAVGRRTAVVDRDFADDDGGMASSSSSDGEEEEEGNLSGGRRREQEVTFYDEGALVVHAKDRFDSGVAVSDVGGGGMPEVPADTQLLVSHGKARDFDHKIQHQQEEDSLHLDSVTSNSSAEGLRHRHSRHQSRHQSLQNQQDSFAAASSPPPPGGKRGKRSDGSDAEAEAEEGLKAKGDVDASHRGVHELFSDILYSNPGEPPTQEETARQMRRRRDQQRRLSEYGPDYSTESDETEEEEEEETETDEEESRFVKPPAAASMRTQQQQPQNNFQLLGADFGYMGNSSFTVSTEAQMRILRRSAEAEAEARSRPHSYSSAYPELQRETGLRVLRRVHDRRQSLCAKQQQQQQQQQRGSKEREMLERMRRRPPNRLRPLDCAAEVPTTPVHPDDLDDDDER